jgi:hypothetical protein
VRGFAIIAHVFAPHIWKLCSYEGFMYILGSDKEIIDPELGMLQEALELLDSKLVSVESEIEASNDPDSDGILDRGEYFIGLGFVSIQQYLNDTLTFSKVNKSEALTLGKKHESGVSFISAINAAANWWKHEAEWWKDLDKLNPQSKSTVERVSNLIESPWYPLSNLLSVLVKDKECRLLNVLPLLIEWRNAVVTKAGA